MIVVDGRTDIEKLTELLQSGGECAELDFKERLDLSDAEQKLNFVKDAVSMYNRYPGGYLIVGATNEGKPSEICEDMDWESLDGAKLADIVSDFVDVSLCPISSLHELDGHKYRLICFKSLDDALPIPFSKLGQFKDPNTGKQKVVFRPGDIRRRGGAQNRIIEHSQWGEILRNHDAAVREDESKRINQLVDRITFALTERDKTPPLVVGMDEPSLAKALISCFENDEKAKLERFVSQLSIGASHSSDILVGLTTTASHSLLYKNDGLFRASVDAIFDIYLDIDRGHTGGELDKADIAVAIYEIGAAAVILQRWAKILPLVSRRSPSKGGYFYASWLRDCQVDFSNSQRSDDQGASQLISLALQHIRSHPILLPALYDVSDVNSAGGELDERENEILDSLCSFDFLYNVCMFATAQKDQDEQAFGYQSYPACVGFSEGRIRPALARVFGGDEGPRRELLPGLSDREIAQALQSLYALIDRQARVVGKFVWGFDPNAMIGPFLRAHLK